MVWGSVIMVEKELVKVLENISTGIAFRLELERVAMLMRESPLEPQIGSTWRELDARISAWTKEVLPADPRA